MRATATCHPDVRHKGRGLCVRCYEKRPERQAAHRERQRERQRRWRAAHPDAAKDKWRKKYQASPEYFRARRLRERYGLTTEDFAALLAQQDSKCAICTLPFDGSSQGSRPAVDHDHATGRVRGLLHVKCNWGIGLLGDSPEGLERALAYLRAA